MHDVKIDVTGPGFMARAVQFMLNGLNTSHKINDIGTNEGNFSLILFLLSLIFSLLHITHICYNLRNAQIQFVNIFSD